MSFHVTGIGTAVPPHRISQQDAAELARTLFVNGPERRNILPVLYRRSGVQYRHSVLLASESGQKTMRAFYPPARHENDHGPTTAQRMERYEAEAGPLATQAARHALEDAALDPDRVTHLITVSCTGFAAPAVDVTLIRALGLGSGTSRTHIGFMGCHAMLNGLRVGAAMTSRDPNACVLVCAVELCTLHQQYGWDPEQIVANALFGDGAAAIVGLGQSMWEERPGDASGGKAFELLANGSTVLPDSTDLMSWRIGNHGFSMTLSPQIPEMIHQQLEPWLTKWLKCHKLTVAQVGAWAIHPGGPRILAACAEALGLSGEQLAPSSGVLADFGNLSSPTVVFILDRLRKSGAARPWVVLGFGPGLAIEAALMK